jgi:membrane-associated phospholipid phosphatase
VTRAGHQLTRRPSRRDSLLLASLVVASAAYFPVNRAIDEATVLYTGIDEELPVVAALALPYLAFLPAYWLTVAWAFVAARNFERLALAGVGIALVGLVVFVSFPTHAPRPRIEDSGWANDALRFVYANDRPYNDFPSMHAASAMLFASYWWASGRALSHRLVAVAITVVVVTATVLIKQHSMAGALAGAVLGACAWALAKRVQREESAP